MLQLVIPAYNEERRLPRTLRELRRHLRDHRGLVRPVEVIVVDNACTDRTSEVALAADTPAMRVRVVRCETPGKGAAVRAGILATDAPVVGFMDADGATDLEALEEGLRRLALGADIALGSRGAEGAVTATRHSRLRDRGARAYRACTARVVPGVVDTQCGFKLMDGELGRRIFADLRCTGFSFDVEMLARARALGAVLDEFPVTWADVPGSTFDPVRHGPGSFAHLAMIAWQLRATRLVPVRPVGVPAVAPVVPLAVEA